MQESFQIISTALKLRTAYTEKMILRFTSSPIAANATILGQRAPRRSFIYFIFLRGGGVVLSLLLLAKPITQRKKALVTAHSLCVIRSAGHSLCTKTTNEREL